MNIEEAKQIRIEEFLSMNGHKPVKQAGHNLWYLSPLRSEKEASFKVNTDKNVWYDFGIGQGGNIIDLAKKVYQCANVSDTLKHMGQGAAPMHPHPATVSPTPEPAAPAFTNVEVTGLHSPELLKYAESRGISADTAKRYCKEIHYMHEGKPYFAIGFGNRSGGYELRNAFFKGCLSPKDVTLLSDNDDNRDCAVFEGFMDFLSARDKDRIVDQYTDSVILNSVANVDKAIPLLAKYRSIECYLDNDEAGRRTFARLCEKMGKNYTLYDRSGIYVGHNDLNEWLVSSKKLGLSTTFSILIDGKLYERAHDRGSAAYLFSSLDETCPLHFDGHTKTLVDDTGKTLKERTIQARLAQAQQAEETEAKKVEEEVPQRRGWHR